MTPQELFNYVNRYALRNERNGNGTVYPTFRQAAKRFHCTYDDIQDAVDGYQSDEGYLGVAIAIGIPGHGYASITPRGNHLIEAYK